MACAWRTRADAALSALAQGYLHQRFNVPAGQWSGASESSLPARPRSPLWDGCITNHTLHLPFAGMADGLVL